MAGQRDPDAAARCNSCGDDAVSWTAQCKCMNRPKSGQFYCLASLSQTVHDGLQVRELTNMIANERLSQQRLLNLQVILTS